jgi:PhnB protein
MTTHIRGGLGAVRPYVFCHLDGIDFVREVFDAVEIERHEVGEHAYHVELRIGDSAIVLEASDPPHASGKPNSIYVYVQDVDAAYALAVARGAETIEVPSDKPYQERSAGVTDRFGNTWWISTYVGESS